MASKVKITRTSRVPIGNALLWWLGLLLYYVWFQALYNSLSFREIYPYESIAELGIGVLCNLLPISAIWWMYIGVVFRWIPIHERAVKIIADILAASLIAVLINYFFAFAYTVLTGGEAYIDWGGTLLNDMLVLMLIEMTYYFKSLILYQAEVEKMRQELMTHKYAALKAQINPHFLFNSFNLLYSLVIVDSKGARQFIQRLAEMYRYILDRHGRVYVSAKEEIDFIRAYIDVLATRYRNKFTVKWTGISPDSDLLLRHNLVPFTLQILVENVVKHNVVSTKSPMEMEIELSRTGVKVINPLHPRQTPSEHSSGFGLKYIENVYSRSGLSFKVNNDPQKGIFEVYLDWLPKEVGVPEHDIYVKE